MKLQSKLKIFQKVIFVQRPYLSNLPAMCMLLFCLLKIVLKRIFAITFSAVTVAEIVYCSFKCELNLKVNECIAALLLFAL